MAPASTSSARSWSRSLAVALRLAVLRVRSRRLRRRLARHTNSPTAGASGAIFGRGGALLVLERRAGSPPESVLGLIVLNPVFTFAIRDLDRRPPRRPRRLARVDARLPALPRFRGMLEPRCGGSGCRRERSSWRYRLPLAAGRARFRQLGGARHGRDRTRCCSSRDSVRPRRVRGGTGFLLRDRLDRVLVWSAAPSGALLGEKSQPAAAG